MFVNQDQVEASEPVTIRAAPSPGDGWEGATGARVAPRGWSRGLLPVSHELGSTAAATAAAATTLDDDYAPAPDDSLDRGVFINGRGTFP